jgi:hypothetical protein
MRYEARGNVVYDSETDTVVETCTHGTKAQQAFCAKVNARKANERDQEWREFDSLMRSNRSLCG